MDLISRIMFLPAIEGGKYGVLEYLDAALEYVDLLEKTTKAKCYIEWIQEGHRRHGTRK